MTHRLPRRIFLTVIAIGAAGSVYAAPPLDINHGSVRAAIAKQNSMTRSLMKSPEVLGTAVGLDSNGKVSVLIYVDVNHPGARGVKPPPGTEIVFTEQFRAGGPKAGGRPGGPPAISYIDKQTPPIALGTSGGWTHDLANGYCCGGTIGSLVTSGGKTYVMSNWHVFESDIVSGGNSKVALLGDSIIQPGLIDVGCSASGAQAVATLFPLKSLVDARNVDVSIAEVIPGQVRDDGAILGIGTISHSTVSASLNQSVKKSGRTSGLTKSKISGLNATISVTYENECAGGTAFTRVFTGQLVVAKGGTFLKSGDSGSLMVEDADIDPRAVGLLYAGSSQVAIANPINEVLSFIGEKTTGLGTTASMVGQ
jgi:hypothetical protein